MSRWRLVLDQNEFDVPNGGQLLIGRGDQCDVLLDEGLVSRQHARVSEMGDKLYVEDLGSRNGTSVNGRALAGRLELREGDIIRIAQKQMRVVAVKPIATPPRPRNSKAITLTGAQANAATEALSRSELVIACIEQNDLDSAERHLGGLLVALELYSGDSRRLPDPVIEAVKLVLRLTELTGKKQWLDRAFRTLLVTGVVVPAAVVDELHLSARKNRTGYTQAMREYVDWVRDRAALLSATEKFTLQRLEGMVRVLSA